MQLALALAALALLGQHAAALGGPLPPCGRPENFAPAPWAEYTAPAVAEDASSRIGPFLLEDRFVFVWDRLWLIVDLEGDGKQGTAASYIIRGYGDLYATPPVDKLAALFTFDSGGLDLPYLDNYPIRKAAIALYSNTSSIMAVYGAAALGGTGADGRAGNALLIQLDPGSEAVQTAPLPFRPKPPATLLSPQACDAFAMVQEYDPSSGRSNARLVSAATGYAEGLRSSQSANVFAARLSEIDVDGAACVATWVETRGAVALDPRGAVLPATYSDASVSILGLPSRKLTVLTPSDWSVGGYTLLLGVLSSPPLLAVVVGRPSEAGSPSAPRVGGYRLRIFRPGLSTWFDAMDSDEELSLYAGQGGSILLWQRTPLGGWRLLLYRSEGPENSPLFHSFCVAISPTSGPLPLVSIYRDQLVWAAQAAGGGPRRTLFRLDIDKDDDGVFDAHDMFPLDPVGTWDSDNDGIADEEDLITATGDCVTNGAPGACLSDVQILYIAWGVFFFFACIGAVGYTLLVRRVSEKHRVASIAWHMARVRRRRTFGLRAALLEAAESRQAHIVEVLQRILSFWTGDRPVSRPDIQPALAPTGPLSPSSPAASSPAAASPAARSPAAPGRVIPSLLVTSSSMVGAALARGAADASSERANNKGRGWIWRGSSAIAARLRRLREALRPRDELDEGEDPAAVRTLLREGLTQKKRARLADLRRQSLIDEKQALALPGLVTERPEKGKRTPEVVMRRALEDELDAEEDDEDGYYGMTRREREREREHLTHGKASVDLAVGELAVRRGSAESGAGSGHEGDSTPASTERAAGASSKHSDPLLAAAEHLGRDTDPLKSRMDAAEFAAQLLIVSLSLASFAISVAPFVDPWPFPVRTQLVLKWADWFFTSIFFIDIFVQYRLRPRDQRLSRFLRQNWYLFPSLVTDVPGLDGTTGVFRLVVITRIFRVLRLLTVLKVVRLIRVYRAVLNTSFFISLLMHRPFVFIYVLFLAIIAAVALAIKITEQAATGDFADYPLNLWFALVTSCTLGYGDYVPHRIVSRAIAIIMAFIGIGLLGSIGAKILQLVLKLSNVTKSMEALKSQRGAEARARRVQMEAMLQHWNPLNMLGNVVGQKELLESPEVMEFHVRKRWTRNIRLRADAELPPTADEVLGAGGKFAGAGIFTASHQRNRRSLNQAGLLKPKERTTPGTRIMLVLKQLGIHQEPPAGIGAYAFKALMSDLLDLFFSSASSTEIDVDESERGTTMERVFGLYHHLTDPRALVEDEPEAYQLQDPLAWKEARLGDVLQKHGLVGHFEEQAVRDQLLVLLLQQGRMESAKWALQNLCYKLTVKPAPPLVNEAFRETPKMRWLNAFRKFKLRRRMMGMCWKEERKARKRSGLDPTPSGSEEEEEAGGKAPAGRSHSKLSFAVTDLDAAIVRNLRQRHVHAKRKLNRVQLAAQRFKANAGIFSKTPEPDPTPAPAAAPETRPETPNVAPTPEPGTGAKRKARARIAWFGEEGEEGGDGKPAPAAAPAEEEEAGAGPTGPPSSTSQEDAEEKPTPLPFAPPEVVDFSGSPASSSEGSGGATATAGSAAAAAEPAPEPLAKADSWPAPPPEDALGPSPEGGERPRAEEEEDEEGEGEVWVEDRSPATEVLWPPPWAGSQIVYDPLHDPVAAPASPALSPGTPSSGSAEGS